MEQVLRRPEASEAVEGIGWRLVLGTLRAVVAVGSLGQGAEVAAAVVAACGDDADRHLRLDVRPARLMLTLQSQTVGAVTDTDVDLARRITEAVRAAGLTISPVGQDTARATQLVEIAVDALDIPAVRPFWQAVFGYADQPGPDGPTDALIDPDAIGPAIWFQQMDQARPQRNRIHFDVSVPHDEAPRRVAAALAAGGRLLSDRRAPAFWVLADPEGNEVCVTTWQGRD